MFTKFNGGRFECKQGNIFDDKTQLIDGVVDVVRAHASVSPRHFRPLELKKFLQEKHSKSCYADATDAHPTSSRLQFNDSGNAGDVYIQWPLNFIYLFCFFLLLLFQSSDKLKRMILSSLLRISRNQQ